jgi:hypothetical protein
LVLIAVGVLWLLGNFGVISAGNLFALLRLWPLLLIAIGLDILLGRRWPLASALIALVTVGVAVAAVIYAPQLGLARADGAWFGPFSVGVGPRITGSGNILTETRQVSGFDEVSFASVGELTITQGERESLTIEAEENLLRYLTSQVRGGRLYLEMQDEGRLVSLIPTRGVKYTLTVKNLKDLDHSGAGAITISGLKTGDLDLRLSGAGNLMLNDLEADSVTYRLSGAGRLEASGEAARQEVRVSGFGEYDGADLKSATTEVQVSGAGGATVWVTESLDVQISGAGSVRYFGSPEVSENISGLGSVNRAGDK